MILDSEVRSPLTPAVLHILLALVTQERHGYGIMQEVLANTEGQLRLGPGTLYGTIKRLIAARFIEESEERPDPALDDVRRRYYRITEAGRKALNIELQRLSKLVRLAQSKRIIDGGV